MPAHDHDEAGAWDRFYTGDGDDAPHWSGQPNPTLVTEVAALTPGRALDVGCGEGGDAIWLAGHGWEVTAIDPSEVALGRARAAARAARVELTWIRTGLRDLPDHRGPYDLVSAHYPVLSGGDDDASRLLRAVAPGGTLLFVHHDLDGTHAAEHGVECAAHLVPERLAAHLDACWDVEVLETRERTGHQVAGGPNVPDVVLRAVRQPSGPLA